MVRSGPLLGVDVGGTFTDVVLYANGSLTTAKVPTTADQSRGVLEGIETVCARAGIEAGDLHSVRHATTVATNALLEGEGAETALVTTAGFTDVLEIGRQDRPALYDLTARKPTPLVPAEQRHGVDERSSRTEREESVDAEEIRAVADRLSDVDSVAVSFLHAYAQPANERAAVSILNESFDGHVSASHDVLPTFREYERTATTVADAFVTPVIDRYLGRLLERVRSHNVPGPRVMQSNGGLAPLETVREHAVTTALSGPAAGVVGGALFEPEAAEGVITFDMGGTSCDVGLVRDGSIERTTEASIGGHPIRIPMVDVNTVGAGGGSIAWVDDGGALRVGPRSAGADPGPACYGQGGTEPTVTDAAVELGFLDPEAALGDGLTLERGPARAALRDLAGTADLADEAAAARGIHRVVTARMSRAIRSVTAERGHDPRSMGIVAFGGAGPMHAAAVADSLNIDTVLVPRANGVLSALGLLAADERQDAIRTVHEPLDSITVAAIEDHYAALAAEARSALSEPSAASIERAADCRYAGQSYELTVPVDSSFDPEEVAARFDSVHERTRGYQLNEPLTLVNVRARARIHQDPPELSHRGTDDTPRTVRPVVFEGRTHETPVYTRTALPVGTTVSGPAIAEGGQSTVVIPPTWSASVDDRGTIVMEGG